MTPSSALQLIECPRDAMQGIHPFIPTEKKITYLNSLLRVGFHTLDFGSFVSPKAIPQMADTHEVINALDLSQTKTKLLAIVANLRGGKDAVKYEKIDYLGFPFSISETFQRRNTNKSIAQSFEDVKQLHALAQAHGKALVIYISMGFGNPYGEPWNVEIVEEWCKKMIDLGISTISLSDTIGTSNPESITYLFGNLIPKHPETSFGAHLHTTARTWREKVDAAYAAGCRRFDGAIKGYGGCPLAQDALCGNMPTENLLSFAAEKKLETGINALAFESAYNQAIRTFPY